MPEQQTGQSFAADVARELSRCRQRGIDDLDVRTRNQEPVCVPKLERLAHWYRVAKGTAVYGRIAAIRTLLRDGLAAYADQGNPQESRLIAALFFDRSPAEPKKRPAELLEAAAKEVGLAANPYRFTEHRRTVFFHFAQFLIDFVAAAARQAEAQQAPPPPSPGPASSSGRRRRPRRRWMGVLLAVLVVVMSLLLVRRLAGGQLSLNPAAVAAPATTITGYVECWPDTTKAAEGVWIVAANGGSGWADRHLVPGHPNIAVFSRTLPHGGSYLVHAGCGGTPQHWDVALDSVTPVTDSGYHFTCYDIVSVQHPYQEQCRPEAPGASLP